LLLLSGVYPHYMGGVSTWADYLVNNLKEFDFTVVSMVSNPHVEVRYKLPKNFVRLITLPLWGSDRPEEYSNISFPLLLRKMAKGSSGKVKAEFCPHYADFVEELLRGGQSPSKMGEALVVMKQFMEEADYGSVMRERVVWETFREVLLADPLMSNVSTYHAINQCRLIEKYLKILVADVGKQDLVHCGIAGTVGLIGVIEKLVQGVKLITTEHGVYFRERILDMLSLQFEDDLPARTMLLNMYLAMVRLVLHYSDAIYPVCNFNAKWEMQIAGREPEIVIYNGVNTSKFTPRRVERDHSVPTIVSVTRVDRLKDPLTLIRAMKLVVNRIPNAKCLIYGPGQDEEYAHECERTVETLKLQDSVLLKSFTNEPEKAYHMGDVFALSSVSEGFPFALIEAMACGLPIVASDVGGVREALEGCGILVSPTNPNELARALITLLEDRELALKYGRLAREKALRLYDVEKMLDTYRTVYTRSLIRGAETS